MKPIPATDNAKPAPHRQMIRVAAAAGIDAGGTRTRCLIVDRSGRAISAASTGPGNWRAYGKKAIDNILTAVDEALRKGAVDSGALNAICLGGAGTGTKEARNALTESLRTAYPEAKIRLENDAVTALTGANCLGIGVIVISGTGALAYGKNSQGITARSDGWGFRLGDEGSSYWIGLEGLKAALREIDGRSAETGLKDAMFPAFGAASPDEVISIVYGQGFSPVRIASLALAVDKLAQSGNPTARDIMEKAGRLLAQSGAAVARRLGLAGSEYPLPVYTAGGTFSFKGALTLGFDEEINKLITNAHRADPAYPPAVGAAILALETVGGRRPDITDLGEDILTLLR